MKLSLELPSSPGREGHIRSLAALCIGGNWQRRTFAQAPASELCTHPPDLELPQLEGQGSVAPQRQPGAKAWQSRGTRSCSPALWDDWHWGVSETLSSKVRCGCLKSRPYFVKSHGYTPLIHLKLYWQCFKSVPRLGITCSLCHTSKKAKLDVNYMYVLTIIIHTAVSGYYNLVYKYLFIIITITTTSYWLPPCARHSQ